MKKKTINQTEQRLEGYRTQGHVQSTNTSTKSVKAKVRKYSERTQNRRDNSLDKVLVVAKVEAKHSGKGHSVKQAYLKHIGMLETAEPVKPMDSKASKPRTRKVLLIENLTADMTLLGLREKGVWLKGEHVRRRSSLLNSNKQEKTLTAVTTSLKGSRLRSTKRKHLRRRSRMRSQRTVN